MKLISKGALMAPVLFSAVLAVLLSAVMPNVASACGGFFCQTLPINQAGEQIVFRQDGDQITAMVQIQFEGEADDFSWVVPVPTTPEYAVGSNAIFTDLAQATQPQFILERQGEECAVAERFASPESTTIFDSETAEDSGVTVESVQEVGGYVVTLISGDNADEVTQWLVDNDYDLNAKGRELLTPYVEAGMKFVAVKLQQNRGTGSIQPLIMKYQSANPMIPIRLTAVAALEDMGVLVWILGDARAVPSNYLHVTPNYTRLDWFSGIPNNAYGSYQSLVTDAMNEAGGQGFATDYAGRFEDLMSQLSSPTEIQSQQERLRDSSDAEYLSLVQNFVTDPIIVDTLTTMLPLRDGQFSNQYRDQDFLTGNYTSIELADARIAVDATITTDVIEPLQVSRDVLDGDRYMTRLYTTLSADEMTLDPEFVYNSDMGDQQLDRNATLNASCIDDQNHWTLKLGAGTGRTDEVVIDTIGPVPFTAVASDQEASWKLEETAATGQPIVKEVRSFAVATLDSPGDGIDNTGDNGTGTDGDNSSSGGGAFGLYLLMLMIAGVARRR